jgi:uncharacterized membrane protein
MIYLWLKALHVAAVLVWSGGFMAVALVTLPASRTAADSSLIAAIQHFDARVTAPAMFLVWAAGLALAMLGQWFPSPWLVVKLAIVMVLSALHGVLGASLRRLSQSEPAPSAPWLRQAPVAIVAGLLAIAVLVVVKPF